MRRRPSPATLIACLALFFSLGGAGLARRGASIPHTYGISQALSPAHPVATLTLNCGPNDLRWVGYKVQNATLSESVYVAHPDQMPGRWRIAAQLNPGAKNGVVTLQVLCG